jgi:hypothetical protein
MRRAQVGTYEGQLGLTPTIDNRYDFMDGTALVSPGNSKFE